MKYKWNVIKYKKNLFSHSEWQRDTRDKSRAKSSGATILFKVVLTNEF